MLRSNERYVYFAGDTGYSPSLQEIGRRFGGFGTGKELVTHAIHDFSAHKHRPFVSVNCSGLAYE